MPTAEERLKILEMIRDGKISAEEGTRLLAALNAGVKKPVGSQREPKYLRVRVTEITSGKVKVNVNLPMSLVNVGIKMGARFVPTDSHFDASSVMEAIRNGAMGKIVDAEAEDEKIEVWVE